MFFIKEGRCKVLDPAVGASTQRSQFGFRSETLNHVC